MIIQHTDQIELVTKLLHREGNQNFKILKFTGCWCKIGRMDIMALVQLDDHDEPDEMPIVFWLDHSGMRAQFLELLEEHFGDDWRTEMFDHTV